MMSGQSKFESGTLKIAVVGSGVAGLSAAWLLSQKHDVTLYEQNNRIGGHAHTVIVETKDAAIPVDTGFIVYNPRNYPNLIALFDYLALETAMSDMSFGVSLDDGAFEYGGADLDSLFAQRSNLVSPRFLSMLRDLLRFYRTAPAAISSAIGGLSLGDFLAREGYGRAFYEDHLLPMAGAIWSAPPQTLKAYPAAAFIRFFQNHGLLQLKDRPEWRTVRGGSQKYVEQLLAEYKGQVRVFTPVECILRDEAGVNIRAGGQTDHYDRVLIGAHADEALSILKDASPLEQKLLGTFQYSNNFAVLHSDARLMPKRKKVWSSWNYIGRRSGNESKIQVTYWMNKLQPLTTSQQLFVTLNPDRLPPDHSILTTEYYTHPIFDADALNAQTRLGELQGQNNTWFCGAYFGSGFHEDGLKSGLDAAEAMGSPRRPWKLDSATFARAHATTGAGA